jgi:hypothetical protein
LTQSCAIGGGFGACGVRKPHNSGRASRGGFAGHLHGIRPAVVRHKQNEPPQISSFVGEDGFTLVAGDESSAVVRTTDDVLDSEISMQRLGTAEDATWYVVRAKSKSVSVGEVTYDGERVRGIVTALVDGDVTVEVEPADTSDPVISIPVGPLAAGESAPIDEQLPDEAAVVVRATISHFTDGGNRSVVGLSDQMITSPDVGEPAPAPTPGGSETGAPLGVWPWPNDDVDRSVLDDPIATARAYVASRVLDIGATAASDFQQGDSTSGEVVFSGDVTTTVFVRRVDGVWHVEASGSDLVTFHDTGESTTAVIETAGDLTHSTETSGAPDAMTETRHAEGGEEIDLGPDDQPGDGVRRERFVLDTVDGTTALAEIALRPQEDAVQPPADAVWSEAGLDPHELAVHYLTDRLPRGTDIGGAEDALRASPDTFELTWRAGVVRLRKVGPYWFVVEAIGDSVQIVEASSDGYPLIELDLTGPGTAHVLVGDDEQTIRNDSGEDDTMAHLVEENAPVQRPVTVRAVFETDSGFVSLAERVID